MLPDRVSNPGPLTYESGALPIALRGPAVSLQRYPLSIFAYVGSCIVDDSNRTSLYVRSTR